MHIYGIDLLHMESLDRVVVCSLRYRAGGRGFKPRSS